MKYTPYILLLLLSSLSACYDDYDNSDDIVVLGEESPQIVHNGTITAAVDNSSSTYYINGSAAEATQDFIIARDISLDANGQSIIGVDNQNIPTSLRQLTTINSATNYTSLSSFESHRIQNFDSTEFEINNLKVDIKESIFQHQNGNIYSGQVSLNIASISESVVLSQWHTYVEGEDFEDYLLNASFGFMLHFSDSSGQQVYADILSIDGADQDIYYLDEEKNRWKSFDNSQVAVQARFFLMGSVTPAQVLTGIVEHADNVVSHQPMQDNSAHNSHRFYSADNGRYRTFVSADEDSTIELTDPCGVTIEIVIIPESTIEQNIDISESQCFVDVSMEVIGCDGEVVDESVTLVLTGGESFYLYRASGNGEPRWVPICGDIAEFSTSILGEALAGPALNWTNGTFDQIGIISACPDHQDGYALIEIDGERKLYDAFDVSDSDAITFAANSDLFKIILRGSNKMTYVESMINLKIDDISFGENGFFINCETSQLGCGIEFCDLTHLKSLGDSYDRIYFEGTAWMQKINSTTAGNYTIKGIIVQ